MKVSDQMPEAMMDTPSLANNANDVKRVSTASSTASTVEQVSASVQAAIVTPAQREADVTFRRDANGQIYYVVSDAQSGEEIIEVPSKDVRNVGQGIEQYMKKAESNAGPHVKAKA